MLKLPVAINVENISTLYKYQLNQNYNIENEAIFSYFCCSKLRKECNLLEMSIGQSLIIVIGYELVSYLLHYSSVRCVTFKELFVCKSNNKTGDFEMNLPNFFSISYKFFRKSCFIRRHTIAQKNFG